MMRALRSAWRPRAACAAMVVLACSDEATVIQTGVEVPESSEAELGPVYALQTLVQTDESVTSFVTLMDTLDISGVPREAAREFPG